jgi:hypothetical protein
MITILSLTVVVLGMVGSWLLSRGMLRAVYTLGMVTGSGYVLINVLLAMNAEGQRGVLLLVIPSAWAVLMSALGLRRLRREKDKVTQKGDLKCSRSTGLSQPTVKATRSTPTESATSWSA